MKETLSILRRDLRRARWTLVLFLLMLTLEVAMSASPPLSTAEVEGPWFVLALIAALATWLIQFLLVTQLIHGDAPSGVGAQWRSRPFRPAHLAMGKIGGILLGVVLPPWLMAQAARLAFGLRPGIGGYEGPLYHLGLVSAFSLIAVVTTSVARALLLALGLLVASGFAYALVEPVLGVSLAAAEQPAIPSDVLLAFGLIGLAMGSLLSGYRKGGLPVSFLGFAWICCLGFALYGGPTQRPRRQRPQLADAAEKFSLAVAWGTDRWNGSQGWYGVLRHSRTEPRRVVAETGAFGDYGTDDEWWPVIVPADTPARVDGLGEVEFVPVDRFASTQGIGPFYRANDGSAQAVQAFGDAAYTVRTYDLLGRLRFDETRRLSGPTWSMRSLQNPRRVEVRTLEPGAKAATFDPGTKQLKPMEGRQTLSIVFWPIGAGVRVAVIRNDYDPEWVLLSETIVGKGSVRYESLPVDLPPDWPSRQKAK